VQECKKKSVEKGKPLFPDTPRGGGHCPSPAGKSRTRSGGSVIKFFLGAFGFTFRFWPIPPATRRRRGRSLRPDVRGAKDARCAAPETDGMGWSKPVFKPLPPRRGIMGRKKNSPVTLAVKKKPVSHFYPPPRWERGRGIVPDSAITQPNTVYFASKFLFGTRFRWGTPPPGGRGVRPEPPRRSGKPQPPPPPHP
jgi:hypothetical protein